MDAKTAGGKDCLRDRTVISLKSIILYRWFINYRREKLL